jgi:hypothetical protein
VISQWSVRCLQHASVDCQGHRIDFTWLTVQDEADCFSRRISIGTLSWPEASCIVPRERKRGFHSAAIICAEEVQYICSSLP